MYRAVVLTTLVILLSVIVGVSVAQESRTFAGGPNGDDPPGSTMPEQTAIEATGPDGTTATPGPSVSSEPEVREDTSERTAVTEPTVGEPEKPVAASPGEEMPAPGSNDSGKPGNSGRGVGKAPNVGKPRAGVGHNGDGASEELGDEGEPGRIVGGQKVTLCHKGTKTLTVGAPALDAHLGHGDTRGACEGGVSGPEPSGETMRPEAAINGEGGSEGGQDKVVLCHKNKTLTVGAGAEAAHLRHGDSPGACP